MDSTIDHNSMEYTINSPEKPSTYKTQRVFDPSECLTGSGQTTISQPSKLIAYDASTGLSRLKYYKSTPEFSGFVVDESSIVIALERVRSRDLNGDLKTVYSLWFGPDSPYNIAQCTAKRARWGIVDQTLQSVELYALYEAMFYGYALQNRAHQRAKVVIMTRSPYLSKGLTERIYEYEESGWANKKIKNKLPFQYIHGDIDRLRKYCNLDVSVWLVSDYHIAGADMLAREVLRGSVKSEDMSRLISISQPLSLIRIWYRILEAWKLEHGETLAMHRIFDFLFRGRPPVEKNLEGRALGSKRVEREAQVEFDIA